MSLLQPYSSKEEAQAAGPDSWSGIGGAQAEAVRVSPASYRRCCCLPGLAPPCRQPLCRSSELETACSGADRLSGTCVYSSGTCASYLLPVVHQQHSNGQLCTRQDSNESNFGKLTASRPGLS